MTSFSPAAPTPLLRVAQLALVLLLAMVTAVQATLFWLPHSIDYTVDDGMLVVDAQLGFLDMGRVASLHDVAGAQPLNLTSVYRTNGTALPDFCHGTWQVGDVGRVWMASTCVNDVVLVTFDDGTEPWVLSPADAAGLVGAVEGGQSATFAAAAGPPPGWFLRAFTVVIPFVLFGVLWGVIVSPMRMRYDVGGGLLQVRIAWQTTTVQLAGAVLVRGMPEGWTWRTWGISMPGHKVGRFRVGGKPHRVAMSDRANAVVVHAPGDGMSVIVSPEDVGGFVAACIAEGAVEP